jgi:hypothetical protein
MGIIAAVRVFAEALNASPAFASTRTGEKIDPNRLVVAAALGLGFWFAFVQE